VCENCGTLGFEVEKRRTVHFPEMREMRRRERKWREKI
jgi:ribosomal protein L37E